MTLFQRQSRSIVFTSLFSIFIFTFGTARVSVQAAEPGAPPSQDQPVSALFAAEKALLDGDLKRAVEHLRKAVDGPDREKALYRLGSTLIALDRPQESLLSLEVLLEEFPGGPVFHKARFLQADALEALKRYEEASRIYEDEITRLLSKDRKEEVAHYYIKYARSLADPEREGGPQYAKALELYNNALELEIPGPLDEDIRLKIASLFHEMKRYESEEKTLEEFRDRYPKSNMLDEVDFRLAEARLNMGSLPEARRRFREFLIKHPGSPRVPEAHRGIALTYQIPKPQSDQELTLGIKALEDFLAASPDNEKAPKALFEIGSAYYHRGRYDEAVAVFEDFIDKYGETPKAREIEELPEIRFTLAQALLKQHRFTRAISMLNGFLVEHAAHHLWDDAQRLIVDTEFSMCMDLLKDKQYEKARTQLQAFCLKHPLDGRAPEAYFALGTLEEERENYKTAVVEWEKLASKYPDTDHGSKARFKIGMVYETKLQDLEAALKAYEKVKGPFQGAAKNRIRMMKAKTLKVITERAFTTAEIPKVKIAVRNIENLAFRAYKLDLRDYFMKQNSTDRVENLDIDLIKPDQEWDGAVENYVKYGEITWEEELPFKEAGAYILNVSDGEWAASVLVLITDLQMLLKSGRKDILVFVENVRTKEPFEGAQVWVKEGKKIIFKGATGKDGVFVRADDKLKSAGDLDVLVASGNHFAANALGLGDIAVAEGLTPRAYLFTDRTIYRPGSLVNLKGFVREVEKGRYFVDEDADYEVSLFMPSGAQILQRKVRVDRFGGFDTHITLDESAPVGSYRFSLKAPSGWTQSLTFPVKKYTLPKAEIVIDLPKDVFYPGEKIEGTFNVRYSYGEPVRGRTLRYEYGTGIQLEKDTDDKGDVPFQIDARDFAESGIYLLRAELPSENASVVKAFHFSTTGFQLNADPSRGVLLAGEQLTVEVRASKPSGKPAGCQAELRVIQLKEQEGGLIAEREVERLPLEISEEDGKGAARVILKEGGRYRFRAAAKDRFDNLITAHCEVFVSGQEDEVKLRIFTDEAVLDAGTSTDVDIHMRCDANWVLLSCEGEQIFEYEVKRLTAGMNKLTLDIDEDLAPNFTYAAAVMDGHRLHTAQADLRVRSSLVIKVNPEKSEAHPGEEVSLSLEVTDRNGNPVEGELAVALVDSALLARYPDRSTPIHEFFFGRYRSGRLKTQSSCTFSYKGRVKAIDRALIQETARRELEAYDAELEEGAMLEIFSQEPEEKLADFFADDKSKEDVRKRSESRYEQVSGASGFLTGRGRKNKNAHLDKEVLERLKSLGYGGSATEEEPVMNDVIGVGGGAGGKFGGKWKSRGSHRLREQFLETAYWNPAVKTGPDGKAKLSISLPDNITTWKILARGLNEKAAGGSGEASLLVRKKLFALLDAPAHLVEDDTAIFRARVINGSDKKLPVSVTLKFEGVENQREKGKEIVVEGGGETTLEFEIIVKEPGTIKAVLSAQAGELSDSMEQSIEVRPFGVAVYAGKSGSAETSIHETIALPGDRKYSHRSMEIVLGPTYSDYLLHLAARHSPGFLCDRQRGEEWIAGRLMVQLSALDFLRRSGQAGIISAADLERRIEQSLASLLLSQMGSGAFPGIGGKHESISASGEGLKAMALATKLGFNVPEKNLVDCRSWIKMRQRKLDGGEKIYCLHAVSFSEKPDFTELNRFYRVRNQLKNAEAAMLALAFLGGGHKDQANTLLDILLSRDVFRFPSDKGDDRASRIIHGAPWVKDDIMTLAHALYALALLRPEHPLVKDGADLLMESLAGRWQTGQATAAAAAALAEYLSGAMLAKARYTLEVSVNGQSLRTIHVNGPSEVAVIPVPENAVQEGENRVDLDFQGRGTYAYALRMTGFTPDVKARPWNAENPVRLKRTYKTAPLMYKGREVPRGFGTVTLRRGERTWSNYLSELNEGEIALVTLDTDHYRGMDLFHTMAVTDVLPAGCSVIESGIRGNHTHYELGNGTITFYVNRNTAYITYPIYGAYKGDFRAPPPLVRSLYDYDLFAVGKPFDLKLNARGAAKSSEYRMTPDELYNLGVWNYGDENYPEARRLLIRFIAEFAPREKELIDAATKLFKIAFVQEDDAGLIHHFELLRERAPSLTLSFTETARVAAAYRNKGENEQALQLLSMIASASFGRESRVAQALEKQEEYDGAVDYMADLILTYPDLPKVQTALFALSQQHLEKAGEPGTKARIPGKTRKQIVLEGIELIKEFLITYPKNPVADEAAYSLISTLLDLEKGREVARLCALFRQRWPDSKLRSSMEYAEAFALFEIGQYMAARDLLAKVSDRNTRGLTPLEKDDRDLARYILGQIEHADGRIESAIARYDQIKDKFEDAAEAIAYFLRKDASLPEVSSFRSGETVSLDLTYRNVTRIKLSIYKVDLMKLYLARKSLNNITDINLAGIKPILSEEITLGDGKDYKDMKKRLDLPMKERGAYLLVVQGDEVSCSGMVLVSDLEMEVQEEVQSGRLRVNVKDAKSEAFQKKVYMKVIGSENKTFQTGYTDLRGIFVAENVSGTSAVIAELDGQYAFHRGEVVLQPRQKPAKRQRGARPEDVPTQTDLRRRSRALQNVFSNTEEIQQRGQQMLQEIYEQEEEGVQIK